MTGSETREASSSIRILHVEDDPMDGELLKLALVKAGLTCDVVQVATGTDFVAAISNRTFDLIISDYTIPGYSGLEALSVARERVPEVPFVFLSATIGEERAVQSLVNGASDYILKQNPRRLIAAVRRVLKEAADRAHRREAEQSAREALNRLQSLIDNAPASIHAKDRAGRFVLANHRFAEQRGLGAQDLLARLDAEILTAGELSQARASDDTVWITGRPLQAERVIAEGGTKSTYLSQKFLLRDLNGAPYALCDIATDVTQLKELETQLRQAQKMEAVGQLAGGIAHDFNNLLTIINGHAELMLQDTPEDDPRRASMAEVLDAGEQAASLTGQLLAFSRRQVVTPRLLDIDEIVVSVSRLLRRLIRSNIKLETKLSSQPLVIKADRSQIEQVVMNLAINARDAMPDGGTLTIATDGVELDQGYAETKPAVVPGHYAVLSISDTGMGMDASTQARIFEPFFTTKELGKGTGLGLATVFGIVKQSGGTIWVYSEVGRGTVFKVHFPLADGDADSVPVSSDEAGSPRGAETILVVEDQENLRRLTCRILVELGYSVLEASGGEEALRIMEREQRPIALLLTDVVMPGMNGRELYDLARRLRSETRVLFLSGYAGETIWRSGDLPQGAAFLQKPFRGETLARKVREALDERVRK